MPELKKSEKSVARLFKKAEEGVVLTKEEQEHYEYISLTGAQLRAVSVGIVEAVETYRRVGETANAAILNAIKTQEVFIDRIRVIVDALSVVGKINVVFQLPKFDLPVPPTIPFPRIPTLEYYEPRPIRIFVEPEERKALPDPRRKSLLPTNAVIIKNNGFMIGDQPITGITTQSKPGKLFRLLISNSRISDIDIYKVLEVDNERNFSFIIRDLKKILLRENKLELDIERYRGIKEYELNGIKKRIRKPKSTKKVAAKTQDY